MYLKVYQIPLNIILKNVKSEILENPGNRDRVYPSHEAHYVLRGRWGNAGHATGVSQIDEFYMKYKFN